MMTLNMQYANSPKYWGPTAAIKQCIAFLVGEYNAVKTT